MNRIELIKRNKLLAAVSFLYVVLFITMPDKGILSVKNSMYYVSEMLQIMPVVFVLTSIIEAWVPKEVIINGFGEGSGVKGNIYSFLLGSFSAGPIYAAFPVCKMLLKKGASITNIVIILSAWAVIKIPMLANEAKFLSFQFMGLRWILTVLSIILMAYAVSIIVKKESIPFGVEIEGEKISSIGVHEEYCIGCGLCIKSSPDYFEAKNKKVKSKNKKLEETEIENMRTIIEECPAKAISFK
ncbi:Ferredoxin [Anaerovirgula multivorans]|uniref:Ferredoxin n=1 Tax=Anaerovirgula multivorans TaxID=312168 RepID=A0A239D104_9FIRM|nr:permease [Anaerovirgula multivorans]SNS25293.1 Ferredoxin [Anaerovirgula multivorans]